jgi:hypothetical protein
VIRCYLFSGFRNDQNEVENGMAVSRAGITPKGIHIVFHETKINYGQNVHLAMPKLIVVLLLEMTRSFRNKSYPTQLGRTDAKY